LPDPGLYELLPLFRHVIFRVFAEISEGGGFLDLFRQVVDQFVLKLIDLCPQLLCYFLGHSFGDYKPSLRLSAAFGTLPRGSLGDRVYAVDIYNPTTDQARSARLQAPKLPLFPRWDRLEDVQFFCSPALLDGSLC
jgi:hypothetical protein